MQSPSDFIRVRGAREHNLKNVDLDIPKYKLVVLTGLSGSGKSSMAFDTIYAEGQRRYVESLSSYARQFLGIMSKPDVDRIDGLSPAISIDQKTTSHNPRSTVGTVTEIYDYLRLLFARVGHPHCPLCGREISQQSAQQITNQVLNLLQEKLQIEPIARLLLLAPTIKDRKGSFTALFENLRKQGFLRVRVDGRVYRLDEDISLLKNNKHSIDVVIDRVSWDRQQLKDEVAWANLKSRLTNSVEQALQVADGQLIISEIKDSDFEFPEKPKKFQDHLFSERFACPVDNISLPTIEPRSFSFNSPHGACPACTGLGMVLKIDEDLMINPRLSVTEGGILPFMNMFEQDTWWSRLVIKVAETHNINLRTTLGQMPHEDFQLLLYGTGNEKYHVKGTNRQGELTSITENFPGMVPELERRHSQTESDWVRMEVEKYMRQEPCKICQGTRLKPEALSVTIDSHHIAQVTSWSIDKTLAWVKDLLEPTISNALKAREKSPTEEPSTPGISRGISVRQLTNGSPARNGTLFNQRELTIAEPVLKEVKARLEFLVSVGLEYLTLSRTASTLAGGEAQRIRLASQIGSGLTGVLYVLDEPSIGLHPRDNQRLIDSLTYLRDLGNTVIVVEHDQEMMESSDWLVDFGPGAGKHGGAIIAQGTPSEIKSNPKSLTGQYLSGKKKIEVSKKIGNNSALTPPNPLFKKEGGSSSLDKEEVRRSLTGKLTLVGANEHNLKNLTTDFPLGNLIVITGVSGSGKSTLVVETLYHALAQKLIPLHKDKPGAFTELQGFEHIDKVILVDQSPIGRTPRSNPATYTGVFTPIRELFALAPEAKIRGYHAGRFSFNVKGGRCEICEGGGQTKIEMQFLSDLYVTCEVCQGRRYNDETLEVEYKGKNISQVLDITVDEAAEFFHNLPQIRHKLATIQEVGLGYIQLGQAAPTLSGGEAQRVKLASELAKRSTGKTIYILDEPTTGLHFADLQKLLHVLRALVDKGNTVIVIEHNLDVIKSADWVIDLGPEGGQKGGETTFSGSPEALALSDTYTGKWLKKHLKN